MGSAGLIWPEALQDEDEDYGCAEQPEFHSPGDMAQWRTVVEDSEDVFEKLGCEAVLAVYLPEMADEDVRWTSPATLHDAADRLSSLIRAGNKLLTPIVDAYIDYSKTGGSPRDLLLEELDQLKTMCTWAQSKGKTRVALEIG